MRFVDQASIVVRSGKGGAGAVSFRRARHLPRGGPDGGNGGRGGDVILEASPRLATLYDFTHRRLFRAENGRPGQGSQKTGRNGRDLVIEVPLGSLVYDQDSGELLADLVSPGQRLIVARGGRGGKGNQHFASPTNRAPRFAQPGQPGQEKRLRLDLKLIADVGLLGLPNAGKSTLLSRLSAAKPKVADYPFTTLNPNLGVVEVAGFAPFVVADLPGLIEGSSQNAGLGHRFLRHAERSRLLVLLLDAAADPEAALATLLLELESFSPELARRQRLIVLNKADLLAGRRLPKSLAGEEVTAISALTGQGVAELARSLAERLERLKGRDALENQ